MSGAEAAGSHDPGAFLLAGPGQVRDLIVNGTKIVEEGHILTTDLNQVLTRQRTLAARLL